MADLTRRCRIGLQSQMQGQRIRVRGQVEGVGFRPFIWALARELSLAGRVLNDSQGVLIEVFGPATDAFAPAIALRAPPLARVDAVECVRFDGMAPEGFAIDATEGQGAETGVAPDVATCPACIVEINGTGRRRGYRSSRIAQAMALAAGLPVARVQHHHAHLAACLADNQWPRNGGQVAGILLDGLGLGLDGTLWGGEVLLGDYDSFTRLAHLRPAALGGSDAASREPWRNALIRLDQAGLCDLGDRLFAEMPRQSLRAAVRHGVNAPLSSSTGRLFDAVAACLGIVPALQTCEGEAALRPEALAGPPGEAYPFGPALDPAPIFCALARDVMQGTNPATILARVHDGRAAAFAAPARAAVRSGQAQAVALSGGCFQNPRLMAALLRCLTDVPVLIHRHVPANDGGLALGQAIVALGQR